MQEQHYVYGQFNISFPPVMDGIANVVLNYVRELELLGHTSYAVVPKASGWQAADRSSGLSHIIRCSSIARPLAKPYVIPFFSPQDRRCLRQIPFDLVHAHYPVRMERFAVRLARERNIPVVATFHTRYREQIHHDMPAAGLAEIKSRRFTRTYLDAAEVWVPSRGAMRVLSEYGHPKDNVVHMPNGTDLPIPSRRECAHLRHSGTRYFPASGGPADFPCLRLVYIGNLLETKNIRLLLTAFTILRARGIRFSAVLAGNGYMRRYIERYCREHGLQSMVRLLGTVADRAAIQQLLAAADLLVFPSVADTDGIVRIEAAAMTTPCAAIRRTCFAEDIRHEYNGFLSAESARDYADMLQYCSANPGRVRQAGTNARDTLYRSWKQVAYEVDARYRRLVESNR